jgi:TolB protein
MFIATSQSDSIVPLTNVPAYFPSWTAIGNRIAFDTPFPAQGGYKRIGVIQEDGSGLRAIGPAVGGDCRDPDWSPDGTALVFLRAIPSPAEWDVFVMDSTGQNVRQLTFNSANNLDPQWAPNGLTIAWVFSTQGIAEIWAMNPDGSNQRKLTDGTSFCWSPDSQRLIVSKVTGRGSIRLWMTTASGIVIRQITS